MSMASPSRRVFLQSALGTCATGLSSVFAQTGDNKPAESKPVENKPAEEKIGIAFIGDSMSDGIWGGMTRLASKNTCLATRLRLGRFGENGTGLTRATKYDWINEAKTIVATFKPALVLVSLGLNDQQNIIDQSHKHYDLGTPAWQARYSELVAELAKTATDVHAGLIWVGIPVLRDQGRQADISQKNEIFQTTLKSLDNPKIEYVAPWGPGGENTFQPFGLDTNGARVQIRAGDGVHFTAAGYDVLAHYLWPIILQKLHAQNIEVSETC